ncbi:hypothetical protein [Stappia sp. WLB 29]|uniref:hypothetical protein n=1 Tax=Stappia sp. WLB 29 TaxID=2925220 RepID=UPI0020BDFC2F|nr:hypothetical protein [Stappia sp. WLB 29]
MNGSFDWLNASTQDRKKLYRVMSKARKARNWTLHRFLKETLGDHVPLGTDYEANARAGRMARSKCGPIHDWLRANHPALCAELDRKLSLASPQPRSRWLDLVETEGQYLGLEVLSLPSASLGIVTLTRLTPIADQRLRLGDRFCFRLTPPFAGHVIAFQNVAHSWHILPLSTKAANAQVGNAPTLLPRGAGDDEPEPLHELNDEGLHRFVFLITARPCAVDSIVGAPFGTQLPEALLDELAARYLSLEIGARVLLRINLLFQP